VSLGSLEGAVAYGPFSRSGACCSHITAGLDQPVASGIDDIIRTETRPDCFICGANGVPLYRGLKDRLFHTPGNWSFRRCPHQSCGLLWLDPMPLESDIGRAYRRYYTHRIDQNFVSLTKRLSDRAWGKLYRSHLGLRFGNAGSRRAALASITALMLGVRGSGIWASEFPYNLLPQPATRRVLEVGFGQGLMLEQLERLGWHAQGIETDERTVRSARERGLDVAQGSLAQQNFPPQSFDAVLTSHVVEHLHDPIGFVREAKRILRPGGRLIAATPNSDCLTHRRFGPAWRGLEPPRHIQVFNSASLRAVALKAGFEAVETITSGRGAAGAWNNSRELERRMQTDADAPDTSEVSGHGWRGHVAALTELIAGSWAPNHRTELTLVATNSGSE
jgi:2-polyprenyl-3-methyl-5-hydroxy-6-metoxy-1,4-benzoquinol methylase